MGINYDEERRCTVGKRDPGNFEWSGARCEASAKFICELQLNIHLHEFRYKIQREALSMNEATKVCAEW